MNDVIFKFEQKGPETITIDDVEPGHSFSEVALKNNVNLHLVLIFTTIRVVFTRAVTSMLIFRTGTAYIFFTKFFYDNEYSFPFPVCKSVCV